MSKVTFVKGGLLTMIFSLFFGFSVNAFTVQQLDLEVDNDFVVGPGKTELRMNPGETSVRTMTVTNRQGMERQFTIQIEDFTSPESEADGVIKLLGEEKGPYSLRDYLNPDIRSFVLQHGDRATIQVEISIPEDATPGNLFGAVIVTDAPTDPLEIKREGEVSGGVIVRSRIASLFFVRVNGEVDEQGLMESFKTDKKIYVKPPITFTYDYKNNGTVYNNPYGVIEIKNLYGRVVENISISPYFVMPGVNRVMNKVWDREFALGRYTATLKMNLGYNNVIEEKTIVFWVLPLKTVALLIVGLFVFLVILRIIKKWFKKNFRYTGGR
jgi:hypothetical protein